MTDTLQYESRANPTRPPGDLVAVAWIFIAFGILAAIEMIVAPFNGRISINLGVLGIFIGRGLFRFRRGWRTCGLAFIWISLVVLPVLAVLALLNGSGIALLVLLVCAAFFALAVWEYRVLTRPDVRLLFGVSG